MPKRSTTVKVVVSLLYCKSVRVNLEFRLVNAQHIHSPKFAQLKVHERELYIYKSANSRTYRLLSGSRSLRETLQSQLGQIIIYVTSTCKILQV